MITLGVCVSEWVSMCVCVCVCAGGDTHWRPDLRTLTSTLSYTHWLDPVIYYPLALDSRRSLMFLAQQSSEIEVSSSWPVSWSDGRTLSRYLRRSLSLSLSACVCLYLSLSLSLSISVCVCVCVELLTIDSGSRNLPCQILSLTD